MITDMGTCCCECPAINFIRVTFGKAPNSQGALDSELVLVTPLYGSLSLPLDLLDPRDLLQGFSGVKIYRRSDGAEIGTVDWTTDNTETGGSSQIVVQHAGSITVILNDSPDNMVVPGTCAYTAPDVELIITGYADPRYYGYRFTAGGNTQ